MRFSIIIPTYNEEHDIAGTLDSLVSLEHLDREIIVVDDSTDTTPQIVQRYADKGVRLIRPDNRDGRCGARNIGILESTGEVLVILNADVRLPHDFLDRIEEHYQAGYDYVLVKSEVSNMESFYARYIECGSRSYFYGNPKVKMEWTEGFSCRKKLAIRAGLFPAGFPVPICAGEDAVFADTLRALGARKKIDLSIVVTHVSPGAFGEYWYIRKGRGRGSPQVRRYLDQWPMSRIKVRATLRLLRSLGTIMMVLPLIYQSYRMAKSSPQGALYDIFPFTWARAVEMVAFNIGEWEAIREIQLLEHSHKNGDQEKLARTLLK